MGVRAGLEILEKNLLPLSKFEPPPPSPFRSVLGLFSILPALTHFLDCKITGNDKLRWTCILCGGYRPGCIAHQTVRSINSLVHQRLLSASLVKHGRDHRVMPHHDSSS